MTSHPVLPIPHPLAARVRVPGSKSHTNRALLVAALASGETILENALFSDDSRYFAAALTGLGFAVHLDEQARTITVNGLGGQIPAPQADLYIGNAGTAARFLTAMLTLGRGQFTLDGEPRMRQRPISDLVAAFNKLGARIQAPTGCPPVNIRANGLPGGKTSIRGDTSSQYLSGLLMTAPYAQTDVEIFVDGPLFSRPYIDLTLGVMRDFGVDVQRVDFELFRVARGRYQTPGRYPIESDASAASYFFAAPAICGGWVEVEHLSRQARQGDIAFIDVLAEMGCTVEARPDAIRITGPEKLRGIDVDMADIPDTAQTLAAIAPFADSPTTIRGIASARVKETDRIAATCTELKRLGVRVDEFPDGMTIYPCDNLRPARIQTYNDHRMAMAFALIGLRARGIEIEDPGCVAKTFPHFFDVLKKLTADR